ncbi:unnamed protein product [Ilex paraguariensis]|uniref:Uncharacterized protein n=1 Tax=Ilex paraguariensis TaxID=185542 RepID=A0ABC8U7L1_9AQUA
MSSWLSFSLPNPFQSDNQNPSSPPEDTKPLSPNHNPPPHSSGVKDDLSVLSQTLTHHLRGVAAFLAPPPPSHSTTAASDDEKVSSSQTILGIKSDLVEIGGSFKTGLSVLSSNKAVSEISRFASSFLPFQNAGDEAESDEDDDMVGIADEVVDFVMQISLRPECWTDFPLSLPNVYNPTLGK